MSWLGLNPSTYFGHLVFTILLIPTRDDWMGPFGDLESGESGSSVHIYAPWSQHLAHYVRVARQGSCP